MITQEFIDTCKARAQKKANELGEDIYLIEEIEALWYARNGDNFSYQDCVFHARPMITYTECRAFTVWTLGAFYGFGDIAEGIAGCCLDEDMITPSIEDMNECLIKGKSFLLW